MTANDDWAELAAQLLNQAQAGGDDVQLNEAIDMLRAVLTGIEPDDPRRPWLLSNLSAGLLMRFEGRGDATDLDDAVDASYLAVAATASDDAHLAARLSNLSAALRARFRDGGVTQDLDRAETAVRLAVESTPSDDRRRAGRLANLAALLLARFDVSGDRSVLDEALAASRESVAATRGDDVDLPGRLSNLSAILLTWFERDGIRPALNEAVEVGRQALELASGGQLERATILANISVALRTRFEHVGAWADLDEAISTGRESLALMSPGHSDRVAILANLGNALHARFEHTGRTADIDEAISAVRAAAAETPTGHVDRAARWSDLGAALQSRFKQTESQADLDEAVAAGRRAVADVPSDGPRRAAMLSNFGNALQARFDRTRSQADLDEAVDVMRAALAVVPVGHPHWASIASSLSNAMLSRFELTGDLGDVDAAVSAGRGAVRASQTDDPGLAVRLSNLGLALHTRYEHTGGSADLDDAANVWAQASSSLPAPAIVRLRAARRRGEAIAFAHGAAAALPAYLEAVDLLPLVVWRGVSSHEQQQSLRTNASALARQAAGCAIAAGQPEVAVQLLEAGRGVLWGNLLDMRTDFARLADIAPELASELTECRSVIDQIEAGRKVDRDAGVRSARRFDELVDEVRRLPPSPGLEYPDQFLRPPAVDTLWPRRDDGPVVIINVSRWGCDALIVRHKHVDALGLEITDDEVLAAVNGYLDVLQEYEEAGGADLSSAMDEAVTRTMVWMWDRIAEPVMRWLGHTEPPLGDWPRVWWCPTGALSLLPLHAAGYHGRPGHSLLDRVISSYTPSLRSLAQARADRKQSAVPSMLVVALAETPQQSALPGAHNEARLLCTWFDEGRRTILVDRAATREAILGHIGRHSWLHASCHGTQDLADPSRGGLVPFDWASAGLVGIADLAGRGRAGGDFAFLSACKTATGGVVNLDEAVTVAAALHYGGWRHVIGTLWSVGDRSTLAITRGVYPELSDHGVLDPDRSGRALHQAIRRLRDRQPDRPSSWAPFIHIGP